MDAAGGETQGEPAGDARLHASSTLPPLSRSAATLHTAAEPASASPAPAPAAAGPAPAPAAAGPALKPRKSLRTRPSHTLERQHAVPPSPLNATHPPHADDQPRSRLTKMSPFNLFGRARAERPRAYAEPSLDSDSVPSASNASRFNFHPGARAQDASSHHGRPRPTSSKSCSSKATNPASAPEPLPPLPNERRIRHFDPPPLFQVWPQTTKHGTFQMATVAPDAALHKPKPRMMGRTRFMPGTDVHSAQNAGRRGSVESGLTVKAGSRPVATGPISDASLPMKIFVLDTSSCLLQYADTGPSDRLPEKILQLGRHSAAYASDLISGQHHVLHIEQAVDQDSVMIARPKSFLSKIGLRGQMAKRTTANFLIVMPGAREMEDWMTAIRREIEKHGGKRSRSDSSTSRPWTTEPPQTDLQKTPSLSHRYQIKRETGIFNVTPLTEDVIEALPPTPPVGTADEPSEANVAIAHKGAPVDGQEDNGVFLGRKKSDAASVSSSTAASVDQRKLDTLRDSNRISHSTVATTSASSPSRTNSISSTPPSEAKEASESPADQSNGSYRAIASYAPSKRRSAVPIVLPEQVASVTEHAVGSPILGRHPMQAAAPPSPPRKNLSTARSVPNLKLIEEQNYTSSLPVPPTAEVPERPESFVGDLPDPTTWNSTTGRSVQARPLVSPAGSAHTRPLRAGSQSFSLPLRVNSQNRPTIKRASRSADADARILSPVPAATTLVAKVDFLPRTDVECHGFSDNCSPPPARALPTLPTAIQASTSEVNRRPSVRLSLFPSSAAPAPPPGIPQKRLSRSPSATVLAASTVLPPGEATALKRPDPLQVRTNCAPFLSPVHTSPTSPDSETSHSPTTVPIRGLKPSRSVATMQTAHQRTLVQPEPFSFSTRRVVEEEEEAADRATPLLVRSSSPSKDGRNPSRSSSRTRSGPRAFASSPELDFVISVAGLGPPAPPPQTPLPEIPTHSRPASRTEGPSLRSGTPIGVAIGDAQEEARSVGLGIEVS